MRCGYLRTEDSGLGRRGLGGLSLQRDEGGGQCGHVRAHGPGRGVARHRLRTAGEPVEYQLQYFPCADMPSKGEEWRPRCRRWRPRSRRINALPTSMRPVYTGGDCSARRWPCFPSDSTKDEGVAMVDSFQHSGDLLLLLLPTMFIKSQDMIMI